MKVEEFIGDHVKYDSDGQLIWGVQANGDHQRLLDLRGWGAIQQMFKTKGGTIDFEAAAKFQDELGAWIVDALNKKLQKPTPEQQWETYRYHCFAARATLYPELTDDQVSNRLASQRDEFIKALTKK
jgi:uncharacterized protein YqjF (DUF2071 family)